MYILVIFLAVLVLHLYIVTSKVYRIERFIMRIAQMMRAPQQKEE